MSSDRKIQQLESKIITIDAQAKIKDEHYQIEITELNESLALLNKEKVNLMREMTLIHENNLKLEKELMKFKDLAMNSQKEIEEYQNQIELYAKVLSSMENKVQNLEQKSFDNFNKSKEYQEISELNRTRIK